MVEREVEGVFSRMKSSPSLKLLACFIRCKVWWSVFIHRIFGIGLVIVVPITLYLISNCETCLETKHRLHAQEIARSLDLRKYDGIICVSGDGVMVEVSKEPHFSYANGILCNLLCSENSHGFIYLSTVDSICLLACYVLVLSLIVILFCF
jgi:hypothetical protein